MADAQAAIQARLNELWEALNSGKPDSVPALFTEDCYYMPPRKAALKGKAAIREHFVGVMADTSLKLDDGKVTEIQVLDNQYAISSSEFQITRGGTPLGVSKSFVLWKKVGDTWFIYRDIYNNNYS